MGLDPGSRRVGVAVSDAARTMAFPRPGVARTGRADDDVAALADLARAEGVATVVVGLPRSLDGGLGPAARTVEAEVAALRRALAPDGVAVETLDERFTTVTAGQRLAEAGVRGGRARAAIDSAAATVLLQSWLERR